MLSFYLVRRHGGGALARRDCGYACGCVRVLALHADTAGQHRDGKGGDEDEDGCFHNFDRFGLFFFRGVFEAFSDVLETFGNFAFAHLRGTIGDFFSRGAGVTG